MLAATHAAFSTALYLGGAVVFEYPTEPVAWGLAVLASPLYFLWPMGFWSILGGYWSHIQIDMANIRGVDLFWP